MAYWLKGGTVLSLFISAAALFMRTLFCIHIYTSAFSFPAFPFAHSACQVTAVHCSCGMPLVVMVVNAVLEKVEKIYRIMRHTELSLFTCLLSTCESFQSWLGH